MPQVLGCMCLKLGASTPGYVFPPRAFVLGVHAELVFQLPAARKRLPDDHRSANRVGADGPDGAAAKLGRKRPNLQFRMTKFDITGLGTGM